MKKMERKLVKQRLQSIDMYDFESELDTIASKIKTWKMLYSDHVNLRIEEAYGTLSWGRHDADYALFGDLLETEAEFEKRKAKAAKERARRKKQREAAKVKKEEKDRKDYERLKKKFEGDANEA